MKTAYVTALEIKQHPTLADLPVGELTTLVRASRTLRRWSELECGNGNDYASWCLERDETTGKPYLVTYPHQGKTYRRPVADKEKGALRRIAAICKAYALNWYHQGDCRGCALYVAKEPLTDSAYTRGVAIG